MQRTSRRLLTSLVAQCHAAVLESSPGWRHCVRAPPQWALLTAQCLASSTTHQPPLSPPLAPNTPLQPAAPGLRPRRPVGPHSSPLAINAALVCSTTSEEVLAIVALCGPGFNDVNASTAFYRLARILRDTKTSARRRLGSEASVAVATHAREAWRAPRSACLPASPLATAAWHPLSGPSPSSTAAASHSATALCRSSEAAPIGAWAPFQSILWRMPLTQQLACASTAPLSLCMRVGGPASTRFPGLLHKALPTCYGLQQQRAPTRGQQLLTPSCGTSASALGSSNT